MSNVMHKQQNKESAQTHSLNIVCKICGLNLTNGWRKKVDGHLVLDRDPLNHVRYRHLSDEFDNWHIIKGQQPPSESEFLEVTVL